MDPLHVPYVDDAMAPLVDGRENIVDLNRRIREKAQKAYEKAMRKGQIPVHARLRVPTGGATQGYVTVPGFSTFDMTGTGLISGRGGLIQARGAYKYPLKYKLDKDIRRKIKKMYLKSSTSGKAFSYKKVYGKLMKKRSGSGLLYRSGGRISQMEGESESAYTARLYEHKKLLKALYYYMKMLSARGGERSKSKGHYRKLLSEVKAKIKAVDPGYKYKGGKKEKEVAPRLASLFKEPEGSGMYYRGPPRTATATGGFLGALLSTAAPLIMEGVKWIGKKIGQAFTKKKGAGAFSDFSWHYPRKTGYPKKGNRAGRYYFWWKVYKLVRKEIPLFFPDRADADALAEEFVKTHMDMFITDLASRIEKHIQEEQATTGKIAQPLIEAVARTEGVPPAVASEIAALPGAETPVGTGILDTIVGMITSPEAKSLLSSAAKAVLPKIVKGVKSFAKGKFMKFISKHPRLQKVAAAYAPGETKAETRPTQSEAPAVASGVSADAYVHSLSAAPGVYQLSRN